MTGYAKSFGCRTGAAFAVLIAALSFFTLPSNAADMEFAPRSVRWPTQAIFNSGCDGDGCGAPGFNPDLSTGVTSGAYAYTSDYAIGSFWQVSGQQSGEVFTWVLTYPNGQTQNLLILTAGDPSNDCWSWSMPSGSGSYCYGQGADIVWRVFTNVGCASGSPNAQAGTWTLAAYDSPTGQGLGNLAEGAEFGVEVVWQPVQFQISHNSSGAIGITSPTDNELFQLTQNNYTETGQVQFSAGTSGSNPIGWTVSLHYLSSGDYGGPDPTPLTFNQASYDYPGYQSIGGQVKATAQTTLSDGSTAQDCVTFYVDGVQSPSPLDPTNQLLNLYSNGATPHLMTGLATHESGYSQFNYPGGGYPGEPDLFNGIQGLWPYESSGGGQFIGLMMVPTTDGDAWDWTQNTDDGVNSTTYGFVGQKLPTARNLANWLTGAAKNKNVPVHQGLPALSPMQLENMALVLYGQYAAPGWSQQFYVPVCPPPGTISAKGNTWTCNGEAWYWASNDPNLSDPGADQNVQAKYIFASGTSGPVGNRKGLQYVTNNSNPLDPWYDSNIQAGVLQQMK